MRPTALPRLGALFDELHLVWWIRATKVVVDLLAILEDFKVLRDGVPAAVQAGAEFVIFDGIESNPLLARICLMSLGS